MRLADRLSHAWRRAALLFHFSRAPLRGSDLRVRRRPAGPSAPVGPDGPLMVDVTDWSRYRDVIFTRFRVEAREEASIRRVLMVFSACAVEVPLRRSGDYDVAVPVPASHVGTDVGLAFELSDGTVLVERQPGARASVGNAASLVLARFRADLDEREPGRILEIGSRARSGTTYRDLVPAGWDYTGVDVLAGPNVDVVADAHELASALGDRRYDAAFSVSVFEHLAMPWKVALELNHVLEPGGLVFVSTHQAYPLHDEPWDFWRFSDRAWAAIFNAATGFEVLEAALGEPATLVASAMHPVTWDLLPGRSFLTSVVLARKVGDPTVEWPVSTATVVASDYPR